MSEQADRNYQPRGRRFYSAHNAEDRMIVSEDEPREEMRGWLLYKHLDGQWVTLREATDDDTREADSRELLSPATEGGASPLDQPVTGSASRSALQEAMSRSWGAVQSRHFAALVDEVVRFQKIEREQRVASEIRGERSKASQSAHHRKLADRLCNIYAANPKRDNRPAFAAVLASEQVVDPAELGSLRNFMEQRRGKPVEMVAGAAIRTIEEQDAELAAMRSTGDSKAKERVDATSS